jgi:peptidoglycan/LPS O-acetylase OafA/YrhL
MPTFPNAAARQTGPNAVGGFRIGQRPCLDGLRGVAVLVVVLTHLHFIPGGVVGLEILFVLSGFLITVLLIEEREKKGEISLRNFYSRRFRRVLPPLIAMLVIGSVVSIWIGYQTPARMLREAAVTGLFLANTQTINGILMPTFGHTWSLALEVQFYLLWPVAFYFLLRAKVRRERILLLLVLLIAAVVSLRIAYFLYRPRLEPARLQYLMRLYMGIDSHSDTLLIGCLAGAAVAWNRLPDSKHFQARLQVTGWLCLAGLGYLVLRCHHEQQGFYCGLFTLTGLLAATVIVWLVLAPPQFLLYIFEWPILVGLGRISYALYLFHMPICQWLHPRGAGPIALALGLSVVAAILSFYIIERPFIRQKRWPEVAPLARKDGRPVQMYRRAG